MMPVYDSDGKIIPEKSQFERMVDEHGPTVTREVQDPETGAIIRYMVFEDGLFSIWNPHERRWYPQVFRPGSPSAIDWQGRYLEFIYLNAKDAFDAARSKYADLRAQGNADAGKDELKKLRDRAEEAYQKYHLEVVLPRQEVRRMMEESNHRQDALEQAKRAAVGEALQQIDEELGGPLPSLGPGRNGNAVPPQLMNRVLELADRSANLLPDLFKKG